MPHETKKPVISDEESLDGDNRTEGVVRTGEVSRRPLTLQAVVKSPELLTYKISFRDGLGILLRPLEHGDVKELTAFLRSLSPESRRLSTFTDGYGYLGAKAMCDAIAKYDKLRIVLESSDGKIGGIIEFSFGIPQGDVDRYAKAGVALDKRTDCRFGPTLADDFQGRGVGSAIFPYVIGIAEEFGKSRIILWGGVLQDNPRAIHYYEKLGFKPVDTFSSEHGIASIDMMLELRKTNHS